MSPNRTAKRLLAALLALAHLIPTLATAACTGSGNALVAATASDLAACITQAAATTDTGPMTITLTAGATYQGTFSLPDTGGRTHPVIIQSSAIGALRPHVRVKADQAPLMPTIISPDAGGQAIQLLVDAHHWTLSGLNVTTNSVPGTTGATGTVLISQLGDGSITYGHWPHDIIIDRCLVHPYETDPSLYRAAEVGVAVDAADVQITNSAIYDFMGFQSPTVAASITGATNANPVVITVDVPQAHPTGDHYLISLSGGTGAWAALNGMKVGTWIDSTHWSLQNYDTTTYALTNIDSTGFGAYGAQAVRRLTTTAGGDRAIQIIAGPGPYVIDNNLLEAYYTALFTGGGGTWIDPANVVTVTAVTDLTHVTLSSVGNLQVGDLIAFSATQDQTISAAATSGANCTGAGAYTCLTVQAHGYPAGTNVAGPSGVGGGMVLSGFTGVNWSTLNTPALQHGTVIDSTHIVIPVDSSTWGAATFSSPIWKVQVTTPGNDQGPPTNTNSQWVTGHVTGISGNNITYEWWGHQPEGQHGSGAGVLIAVNARAQFKGLVLHDLTVTHNTLSIRQNWLTSIRNVAGTCNNCVDQASKGVWESKMANNVLLKGNIIEISGLTSPFNSWSSISLNQVNQTGSTPWVTVSNWTIQSNIFKNYTYFIISMAEEYLTGAVSHTFLMDNNLLTPAVEGWAALYTTDGATITHNTVRNLNGDPNGYSAPFISIGFNTNTVLRDNIAGAGAQPYVEFTPFISPTRGTNYFTDEYASAGCPGKVATDVCIANPAAMLFVDYVSADAGGNYYGYKLQAGSPGHNAASDGTDVGVNFRDLDNALGTLVPGGGSW